MAEKLTPQQAQAVNDRGGRLLVSAAAGSGKTKVLVDRILKYLMDPVRPASLDEFLIITYTKAAAAELRGKIAAKLTERISENPENRHLQQQMQRLYLTKISTVHSFCSDLLRSYAYRLDLPADFRVADENECRELRRTVVEQLLDDVYENAADDPDFRCFVDSQGLGRNDALVPEIILKVYDSARCHLNPEKWLETCIRESDVENMTDAGETIWGRYLMDALFHWLDLQIEALSLCRDKMEKAGGFDKPCVVISDTVFQLRQLRESVTWEEICRRIKIDFGVLTFARKGIDFDLAEKVKAVRGACKTGLEKRTKYFSDSTEHIRKDLDASSHAAQGLVYLVREFGKRYDRAKEKRRVLDFGDLEHKTLDLLLGRNRSSITVAAHEIGQQFREILVDEYQDSNAVQDAIFSALTEKRQNLFMVGDVKQSIYQFRLADPGIFLNKYASYVPAEDAAAGQGRKALLSANFRSGGAVLSAVNQLFRVCMSPAVGGLVYGEEESLREGIPHESLGEPEVELHMVEVQEDTYPEEAEYVANRICQLLDGNHMVRDGERLRPIVVDDIVILLRSPGSVGSYFQNALQRRGIRCTSGGSGDLLQTPEIHTLRSLLQTISNPRQDIPLLAVMTSPVFGFTADELAIIRASCRNVLIYDAVLSSKSEKCRKFTDTLSNLRWYSATHNLAELIERIMVETSMDSIYAAMENGEQQVEHIQSFYQLASDYEQISGRDLNHFLEHLDTLAEKGLQISGESESGCVTIMSIHKSKGLEFPVVFLAGLSRVFNRESVQAQVLCDQELGLGLSCVDPKNRVRYPSVAKKAIALKTLRDSLSEELRVLYVAMTRARDRLIMTYASRKPEAELKDIALRIGTGGQELLTADVVCPGEWVLYAALQRAEAHAFHGLVGRPDSVEEQDYPWLISLGKAEFGSGIAVEMVRQDRRLPYEAESVLRDALSFQYEHITATDAPSKQTATAQKGRYRDQEAAENAPEPFRVNHTWRKPAFRETSGASAEFGTLIHRVMQYLDYRKCVDPTAVTGELQRLVSAEILSDSEAAAVDPVMLYRLFETELGHKLRFGNILREFKFSVLEDGGKYAKGLDGEQVLLQGVVDCALLEDDGITVVDFKTDYATEASVPDIVQRYRGQVQTYADAMVRIYELPVKAAYLYLFRLDRFVQII